LIKKPILANSLNYDSYRGFSVAQVVELFDKNSDTMGLWILPYKIAGNKFPRLVGNYIPFPQRRTSV
jgi:hypothetical protein